MNTRKVKSSAKKNKDAAIENTPKSKNSID